jgi:leucine-rich repeat protein SHOC2
LRGPNSKIFRNGQNSKSSRHAFVPFFCAGFPEPEPGEWPVRWTLTKLDITLEAERLLGEHELGGPVGEPSALTDGQRRWQDLYAVVLALVHAKRKWRRHTRREMRDTLLEWANVRPKEAEEQIPRQTQTAAVAKALELPGLKLREIPHEVLRLKSKVAGQVKRLVMHDNRIEFLPPELFVRFTEISTLRLSGNRIAAIPSTIMNLTSLQMLLINDNDLCILPPALGELVSLHTLHVQGNKRIQRLPLEMGKLHHQSMGGHIKDLTYDKGLVQYPPLETVEQGLNLACDLMRRVWNAGASGRLLLSGMSLATVPPYICDAPLVACLTELNIFQNKITRLPPAMGLLSRLELLRLDEASIVFPNQHLMKQSEPQRDPETRMLQNAATAPFMGFLRRIADCRLNRSMVLQGGAWKYGGAELTLNLTIISTEILNQSNCKLLDVRHNELKEIPEGISRLPHLTALHADHNRIRHLPESLGALFRLRAFTCADNSLYDVPEVFSELTCLVSLDLSKNSLREAPKTLQALTALTRLNLSHNKLHQLPDTLSKLCSLRYLYVGHNPLRQLPPALGASQWLTEVSADCCLQIAAFTPPEVLSNTVPPRCPLADPQLGNSHLLCNVHRIVGMLAEPGVLDTFRQVISLPHLLAAVGNGNEVDADLPAAVKELVKISATPHIQLTAPRRSR